MNRSDAEDATIVRPSELKATSKIFQETAKRFFISPLNMSHPGFLASPPKSPSPAKLERGRYAGIEHESPQIWAGQCSFTK